MTGPLLMDAEQEIHKEAEMRESQGMTGPFLKHIRIQNFKSFADVDLELGRFNVMIGGNAAGKSNLVQVLRFLRDIRQDGLDSAVSMQGGPQYIGNLKRLDENTVIELETRLSKGVRIPVPTKNKVYSTGGKWRLEFKAGEEQKIEIVEDSWEFYVSDSNAESDVFAGDADEQQADSQKSGIRKGTIGVTRSNGGLCFDVDFDEDLDEALGRYTTGSHAKKNELLAESGLLGHLFPQTFGFEDIGTYDFNPKLAGESTPVKGMQVLEDDGSNLALVLNNILADDENSDALNAVVSDLLPFVKSIGVTGSGRSIMFTLTEKRLGGMPLPSPLLSDGTVSAVALAVALYFEPMPVVAIEEPEKNMHPSLMARTVEMLREASKYSQIMITTHSPELVRYAGVDSLYAIKRGEDGFSEISRPATNSEIMEFLKNDMGIDEMHVQNMLEW